MEMKTSAICTQNCEVTGEGTNVMLLACAGLFGNSKCMLCFWVFISRKGNKIFVWSVGSCWPGKIQTVFHNNVNSFLLSPFSFRIHIALISVPTSRTSTCWTWCDTWLCSSPCTGDIPSASASGNLCSGVLFCWRFPPRVTRAARLLSRAFVQGQPGAAWALVPYSALVESPLPGP